MVPDIERRSYMLNMRILEAVALFLSCLSAFPYVVVQDAFEDSSFTLGVSKSMQCSSKQADRGVLRHSTVRSAQVSFSTNGAPIHSYASEFLNEVFTPYGTGSVAYRVEVDVCVGSSQNNTFYHNSSFSLQAYTIMELPHHSLQCNKDKLAYANPNLTTA
ncbi:hypothetical protein OXYTRIMIC_443 [Oxytricha trifallax]|uniref:Uncharacterized protein n=1 Tax=Oxytricha trifallax TaxID=1172189 RepID=A0A073I0X2_9SPIT|nr:hypothetical protein OXYTRIMIC_443 [Oxytricha trifallax]